MKILQSLSVVFLFAVIPFSCTSQNAKNDKVASISENAGVEVVYFHYTRRCVTCNSVEEVAKEAVMELANNQVSFMGYNLDEAEGKERGKQLGVSGQTLMILNGDKKVNLTNEGFMNARSNPDKLKAIIQEKAVSLL